MQRIELEARLAETEHTLGTMRRELSVAKDQISDGQHRHRNLELRAKEMETRLAEADHSATELRRELSTAQAQLFVE